MLAVFFTRDPWLSSTKDVKSLRSKQLGSRCSSFTWSESTLDLTVCQLIDCVLCEQGWQACNLGNGLRVFMWAVFRHKISEKDTIGTNITISNCCCQRSGTCANISSKICGSGGDVQHVDKGWEYTTPLSFKMCYSQSRWLIHVISFYPSSHRLGILVSSFCCIRLKETG